MTLSELRLLYHQDQLVEAIIEPSIQENMWIVEFRHTRGGLVPLTDSKGCEQHYQDVDMASKSALAVGFNQVRIANDSN
ncbi:hypothetical protein MHO82_17865 [Vibrio sp. Of7-15]|uniref:hypothetical protein n=1 Tax=Vibrio sp. Of7-15 TaxID=2724879 RepID=UPI001EF321CF|nr:hypothetical protein [Vibrio sp. Of7-15]MCG7498739.1 hypothetical protein [Vibrio sp. Of7-15]